VPSRKQITAEKLEKLGARRLAELLEAHGDADPVLRKKLQLVLAAAEGVTKLTAQIDKRIRALGRGKSFIDWEKRKPLATELAALRTAIAEDVAPADARAAAERMLAFVNISDTLFERIGNGSGMISEIFAVAVEDLGRLWAGVADRDPVAMARVALDVFENNDYGAKDGIITALGDAMGAAGQAELKRLVEAKLGALPRPTADDWSAGYARRRLAYALLELADLRGNVDAFIAACRRGDLEDVRTTDIARRLLAAGRADEALRRLEGSSERRIVDPFEIVDLKIAALEQLGRPADAQAARWTYFTETLSARHLRDYLKRLPDFDDFEAQEKAVSLALSHRDVHRALTFLVELPDLPVAERLVRERLAELDGQDYVSLSPAADKLAGKFPIAATLLYRRMAESILKRASANQYGYAVRDVRNCESLAGQLPADADIENHATFMVRLRHEHGRKWKFWELLGA
jgi:hypothetical protein